MIIKILLTSIAAGLLFVASGASFAQTPFGPSQAASEVQHTYQGGPKTVVPHGDRSRRGAFAGAHAESDEIPLAVPTNQNPHRYYGGPKYH